MEGLALQFTGADPAGQPMSVTCPLRAFDREGDGKSLRLRIKSSPGCPLFEGNSSPSLMLHLINKIRPEIAYREGRETRTWDGRVLETPREKTYVPEIGFAGTLSIRGYGFGVQNVGGNR